MNPEECQQKLVAITEKLNPVLNPLGYVFEADGYAVSSGGPFASGFFVNGEKKIGLIYRSFSGLGSVNYECRQSAVSHSDLMRYLGKEDQSKLKYDSKKFSSYAREEGDVLDALIHDIQSFEIDLLTSSSEQFYRALRKINKSHNASEASKVVNGIIIGVVLGGAIGLMFQNMGLGVLLGFMIGWVGGIYVDIQRGKKKPRNE
jgi:hypothetical protein